MDTDINEEYKDDNQNKKESRSNDYG